MEAIFENNKEIISRYNYDFIQGKNPQVFEETIHPEFINHSAPPNSDTGKVGVLQFTQFMWQAFPDLEVKIHMQVAEADLVTTYKTFEATHKGTFMGIDPTNKRIAFNVMDIIRVKDGKAIEHWSIGDTSSLLRQLTA